MRKVAYRRDTGVASLQLAGDGQPAPSTPTPGHRRPLAATVGQQGCVRRRRDGPAKAGPSRGRGYGYGTTVLVVICGLRVAHHRNHGIGVSDGRRPTCAVDHVQDATRAVRGIEEDREQIVEASRRELRGNHERVSGVDVHALIEEAVASHAPGLESLDIVGDPDGRVAERAVTLSPGGLAWRVIRHLVLEEDDLAVLAVPDDLVLLEMLDEQTRGGDVVAVHDHAGIGGVARPADAGAVVGPPGPDVVEDDVAGVDFEADGRLADACAADAEVDVLERARISRVA